MTRSRSSQQFHSQGGFTLLELLVATAVGAIVLLAINTTFFGALRLHNTTHAKINQDLELQRALGIVRHDLAGIVLPPAVSTTQTTTPQTLAGPLQTIASSNTSGTQQVQDIQGDRVTPDLYLNTGKIDGWTPFSEMQTVAYYLQPMNDGSNLKNLLRVVIRNMLPSQTPTDDQQVLLTGVSDATIFYYDGTDWTDQWDSTQTSTLPSAIKFRVTMGPSDPSQPLLAPVELVVPVYVVTTTSATATANGTTGQ
jgi:type II secretion system protein J